MIHRMSLINFLFIFSASVICNFLVPTVYAKTEIQEPNSLGVIGGFSSREGDVYGSEINAETSSYVVNNLKFSCSIWSDGIGSVLFTEEVENLSDTPMNSFTLWFSGYAGPYEDISAIGLAPDHPRTLKVVSRFENGIHYYDVIFHKPIAKGEKYQFKFRITIGGMSHWIGLEWETYWRFQMSGLRNFTQEVAYPANSSISLIEPVPTSQRGNILTWTQLSTDLNIDLTSRVQFLLSYANPATLLYQNDILWGGETLGYGPETIGSHGCYITSAAMLINYFSSSQISIFETNPLLLNGWLLQNKGFASDNTVSAASKFQEYVADQTSDPTIQMFFSKALNQSTSTDNEITRHLSSGYPVILKGKILLSGGSTSTHFAVAVERVILPGSKYTYRVMDPVFGDVKISDKWINGNYTTAYFFSASESDTVNLTFKIQGNTHLVVTDRFGRRAGYDPIAQVTYDEIPGAYYGTDELPSIDISSPSSDELPLAVPSGEWRVIFIPRPEEGYYSITVFGLDEGEFQLSISKVLWQGISEDVTITGIATPGSVQTYSVPFIDMGETLFLPILTR